MKTTPQLLKYFRNSLILIILIMSVITVLKYCNEKNTENDIIYYKNNIQEEFDLLVSFKNTGRQWGLYLSKTKKDIDNIKEKKYPIGDPYKIPKYPDIEFALKATQALFENARVGNRIEKLPNGNKCYLYKNDSIYRYNCLVIPEKIREIVEIEEWETYELGYWKLKNEN